jgi:hypothetical protein
VISGRPCRYIRNKLVDDLVASGLEPRPVPAQQSLTLKLGDTGDREWTALTSGQSAALARATKAAELVESRFSDLKCGKNRASRITIYRCSHLTARQPSLASHAAMPDDHQLTLRQADQARTDFAAIESNLEFIMSQLARLGRGSARLGRATIEVMLAGPMLKGSL